MSLVSTIVDEDHRICQVVSENSEMITRQETYTGATKSQTNI